MKFGKQFVSQMVPEWHEAYMDYAQQKTLLKEIIRSKLVKNKPTTTTTTTKPHPPGLNRKALSRAFSGLVHRHHETPTPTAAPPPSPPDIENQVIQVKSVNNRDGTHSYETTMFLKSGGDEEGTTEYELMFFNRLDDEFNKVNNFYTSKVKEVMEEAVMLEKQMHALVAFRIRVEKPDRETIDMSAEMTPLALALASDDVVQPLALSASSPKCANSSPRRVSIDVIEEGTRSQEQSDDDESSGENKDVDTKHDDDMEKKIQEQTKKKPSKFHNNGNKLQPCPLKILDRVKMNVTPETPLATIKALLNVPNQTELKFNKENLRNAEEQLKQAFSVFYHKLLLLKNYSFMNMLAFSKIMKKYDKVTSRNASKAYMKMVDKSILGSSTDVSKLIERVETTFIKHFTNSNRAKGMKFLRPKAKKERHRVTFSLGFFAGCTVALLLALILIIRARNILDHEGGSQYMNTMFPLYSLFGFVVLHMVMYAGNIYFWRRYRVNYSFIFGFRQGTELGYREVLYLSFGLTVLALASVLSNLDMEMDPRTLKYEAYTELLPLTLLIGIVGILICPFNVIYRSSRFFFLSCVFHCLCAPLYKVSLPDSIIADQLTSQVQAIRSLEFYVCYYSTGKYLHRQNTCRENDAYSTFYFIVAAIPYVMRFLQCLRRLFEEKDKMHAYNGLKYFATVAAVCTRTAYSLQGGMSWRIVAFISSGIAAVISTYWDIVIDWGLLQRNSKNFWLRDKLLIPHKSVYFVAMVLNVLLRFAWLQTVSNFKVPVLHTEALVAIVASLEIIRRGIWNFFRLENEHLNNVGKFRAFKSVPLPFNYDENEEKNV